MDIILSKKELEQRLANRNCTEMQRRLGKSTVAVCGLGGLGSHIALCLARTGVGKLILIDSGRVEARSLERQQYGLGQIGKKKTEAMVESIKGINPYCKTETYDGRLIPYNYEPVLRDASIICEAMDKAEEKSMLANYVLEHMPDKYLVAASGMAGLGNPNEIVTQRLTQRFFLCGDGESDTENGETLYAARVMLCAAHQAYTVLRIIAEVEDI